MPRVVLRVNSNFDEQAARAAAREAQRYWERQSEQLKVNAKLDEASARKAEGEAKEFFLRRAAEFRVEAKISQTSARQVVKDAERIGKDAGKAMSAGLSAVTPAGDAAASSLQGVASSVRAISTVGGHLLAQECHGVEVMQVHHVVGQRDLTRCEEKDQ